jgi:hypothetical protein
VTGSIILYSLQDWVICQDDVIVIETLSKKAMRFCGYSFVKWGIERMDQTDDHNELI